MVSHFKIHKAQGVWFVRAGGAILGETANALEVTAGDASPVIYFPRDDIAMAFLDPTDMMSHSPTLGQARYFSVVTKSKTLENVVWSFEDPKEAGEMLRNYLAFHNVEEITLENI